MERLTERYESDGTAMIKGCGDNCKYGCRHCTNGGDIGDCGTIDDVVDKLASYEDAEEQGLLLRLPCPIGTPVYVHAPFCEICESDYPCEFCTKSPFVSETKFDYEMIPLVGELVFLTREEAEKALADMGV